MMGDSDDNGTRGWTADLTCNTVSLPRSEKIAVWADLTPLSGRSVRASRRVSPSMGRRLRLWPWATELVHPRPWPHHKATILKHPAPTEERDSCRKDEMKRRLLCDGLGRVLDDGDSLFVGPTSGCVRLCVGLSVGSPNHCGCITSLWKFRLNCQKSPR